MRVSFHKLYCYNVIYRPSHWRHSPLKAAPTRRILSWDNSEEGLWRKCPSEPRRLPECTLPFHDWNAELGVCTGGSDRRGSGHSTWDSGRGWCGLIWGGGVAVSLGCLGQLTSGVFGKYVVACMSMGDVAGCAVANGGRAIWKPLSSGRLSSV